MTTRLPILLLLTLTSSLPCWAAQIGDPGQLHDAEIAQLTQQVRRLTAQVKSLQETVSAQALVIAKFKAGQVIVEDPQPTSRPLAKKPIAEVNPDAWMKEVYDKVNDPDVRGTSMVYWLPYELWQFIATTNPDLSPADRNGILKAFEGVCVVAVVRISTDDESTPVFLGENEVAESLTVTYISPDGTKHILQPLAEPDPIVTDLFSIAKPTFSAVAGPLGEHLWFFTYSNVGPNGQRIVSPYKKGRLQFDLAQSGRLPAVTLELDTLANALHMPRVCATCEHPMQLTWTYCPWCGKKLSESSPAAPAG